MFFIVDIVDAPVRGCGVFPDEFVALKGE